MRRIVVSLVVPVLAVGALGQTVIARQSATRTAIEAATQKFVETFKKGDAAGLAAFYTPDGEALPPNDAPVQGREAIQKMWQSVLDGGTTSVTLTTREVEGGGDFAWETGTYELFGKDGGSVDRGKYVVIWKRSQGRWLLHRDIWNSSNPAKS